MLVPMLKWADGSVLVTVHRNPRSRCPILNQNQHAGMVQVGWKRHVIEQTLVPSDKCLSVFLFIYSFPGSAESQR